MRFVFRKFRNHLVLRKFASFSIESLESYAHRGPVGPIHSRDNKCQRSASGKDEFISVETSATQEAVLTASAAQLRARLVLANARVPIVVGLVVSPVRTQTPSPQQIMEAAATREFEGSFMRQEFGLPVMSVSGYGFVVI